MNPDMQVLAIVAALAVGIWFITRWWLWLAIGATGLVISVFAILACIIHFRILAAFGFFLLANLCFAIALFAHTAGAARSEMKRQAAEQKRQAGIAKYRARIGA